MNRLKKSQIIAIIAAIVILISGISLAFLAGRRQPEPEPERRDEDKISPREIISYKPLPVWYNQKEATYYDLSAASRGISKSYILITGFDTNDNPVVVPNQYDILDSQRGGENYSDFREIIFATVPKDYTSNSVKSVSEIINRNWPLKETGIVENRPQIPAEAKIEPERLSLIGWMDSREVYFWLFENFVPIDSTEPVKILAGKLYIPVKGYDGQGNPIRVSGQRDIVDSIPGQKEYTPLRQVSYVEVPNDYAANSIKSIDEIKKSGYKVVDSGRFINAPIYEVEGKVATQEPPSIIEEEREQTGRNGQVGYDQGYRPPSPDIGRDEYDKFRFTPNVADGRLFVDNEKMNGGEAGQEIPGYYLPLPYYGIFPVEQESVAEQEKTGEVALAPPQAVQVDISDCGFEPNQLQISAITAVTWINNDLVPRTVTAENGRFDSNIIWPGGEFTMIFTEPGIYPYRCSFHPEMAGVLIVQPNP